MRLQNVTWAAIGRSYICQDLVFEVRQIGAERAGADAAREVLGQLGVVAPDALDTGADVFRYQRPRPLDVRGTSTHAAMPPDSRGKLVAISTTRAVRQPGRRARFSFQECTSRGSRLAAESRATDSRLP